MPAYSIRPEMFGELTCWRVESPEASLLIAEQGAQILHYQRAGEPPLIWLSDAAQGIVGQSVRGGVPICWPWFGDLARNPVALLAQYKGDAAPFHGLVRNRMWVCVVQQVTEKEAHLRFTCPQPEEGLPGWPHAVEVALDVRLGTHLQVSLCSENKGSRAVWISQALHTYYAVSDVQRVSVYGLENSRYIETLDQWRECTESNTLTFQGETDRIYFDLPSRLELHDEGWKRRVMIDTHGSRSAVLWNPWIDKAQRLSQYAPDAWQRMLCIETANVWNDCVELKPGTHHQITMNVWSTPLI